MIENILPPDVIASFGSSLQSYHYPFRHWIIEEFLTTSFAHYIRDSAYSVEDEFVQLHSEGYEYFAHPSKDVQRFIYSEPLRNFLSKLYGKKLVVSSNYPFAQVYRFRGASSGISAHTDFEAGNHLAVVIFLNEVWCEEWGGGLSILEGTKREFTVIKTIKPKFNRGFVFEISKKSLHRVDEILTDNARMTLIFDYNISE